MMLVETAGAHRFRSKDAYARFTGTAPIPVWSGTSSGKVRLNRGGNRTINTALHTIAITQARGVGRDRGYPDKLTLAARPALKPCACCAANRPMPSLPPCAPTNKPAAAKQLQLMPCSRRQRSVDHCPPSQPARARPAGRAQQAGSAGGQASQTTTSAPPQAALT